MQVNPEDSPPKIYVTWSNARMTDFENQRSIWESSVFTHYTRLITMCSE